MKRYLVRAGFDPTKHYRPRDLLKRDYIGGNSGNMMFAYGVMNVLTTDQARCTPTYYQRYWTEEEIEYINQTYDAFILPLADAFRDGFIPQLKAFTALMKKLTIPCIVIGVGFRGDYEPQFEAPRRVDSVAKEFVSEVLNHSSCLGLRGGITADYLSFLGFIPEKDFTVIGCPSLYMHGLSIKMKTVTQPSRAAVVVNSLAPETHRKYMARIIESSSDITLIQQRRKEFIDLYYGRSVDLTADNGQNTFSSFDYDRLKKENRAQFFFNVPEWFQLMKQYDVLISQRFHGTAASILSGVPSVIIPFDARTRELAEYHHLESLNPSEVQRDLSVESMIERIDFKPFIQNHEKNLTHYLDFLNTHSLETVFKGNLDYAFGESLMEKDILSSAEDCRELKCYAALNQTEKVYRSAEYYVCSGKRKAKQWIKSKLRR